MEPLAVKARTGRYYRGLQVREQTHHIALYADDLLMFLVDTGQALLGAKALLHGLGEVSGLKVNWAKSRKTTDPSL